MGIVYGDINCDGNFDILVINYEGELNVFY